MFWFWSPLTYIFILIFEGLLLFFPVLSSNVHCEVLFSDYQGNGAFFFFSSNKLVKTNKLCQSGSRTQLWRNGVKENINVALSGMFRMAFLSSWCWMSPYSDSHFDLLTYAKQKKKKNDPKKKNNSRRETKQTAEISCHSPLKDNEQFQSSTKGHYVVLFLPTRSHTHTYRH